ncbi:MAG: hypothetical protein CME64_02625 [Halobacteriovoraceae bacterium]|nr:hypothetical protein [Halobacteriovoraceae bacterium]|tara:strand:- start:3181 stop:3564 length:384 start_codon:yes stop_codon:yes gene_type:complete
MFRVAFLVLITAASSYAQNLKWADLVESRTYKVDRDIELSYNAKTYQLRAQDELKLLDFRPLSMINVFLAEFKILNCKDGNFSSEMVILEVDQPSGKAASVGVDMAKKCVLEIFVEKKDYNAISIIR